MRILMVENDNEVDRLIGRIAVKIGTLIRLVSPMNILFVTATRIGDAVLSTGLLALNSFVPFIDSESPVRVSSPS